MKKEIITLLGRLSVLKKNPAGLTGDEIENEKSEIKKRLNQHYKHVKKLVIVKLDAIGDSLLFTNSLKAIRTLFPETSIIYISYLETKEIIDRCPYINTPIYIDRNLFLENKIYRENILSKLYEIRCDILFNPLYSREYNAEQIITFINADIKIGVKGDLSNISQSILEVTDKWYDYSLETENVKNKFELRRNAEIISLLGGDSDESLLPELWEKKEDDQFISEFIENYNIKNFVIVFPGSKGGRNSIKYWGTKKYAQLIDYIQKKLELTVVIHGGVDDAEICSEIAITTKSQPVLLSGHFSLWQSVSFLKRAKFYVGADTSIAHFSAALKIPTIVILGGGHLGRFFPYPNYAGHVKTIYKQIPCYNCNWKCTKNEVECITNISLNDVLTVCTEFVEKIQLLNPFSKKDNKQFNLISERGSNLKLDLIVSPNSNHSWHLKEGWIYSLRKRGILNKVFHVNEKYVQQLFEYLNTGGRSDLILALGGDHHLYFLHDSDSKQQIWKKYKKDKVCYSYETSSDTIYDAYHIRVRNALKIFTHYLVADEADIPIYKKSDKEVVWFPQFVDERLFNQSKPFASRQRSLFFKGKLWNEYVLRRTVLRSLLESKLCSITDQFLSTGELVSYYNSFMGTINPPGVFGGFNVRTFEALACGNLLFQFKPEGRPLNNALFKDGKHLIYFDAEDVNELIDKVKLFVENPGSYQHIAEEGHAEVLKYHTLEKRIDTFIDWIIDKKLPQYPNYANKNSNLIGNKAIIWSSTNENYKVNITENEKKTIKVSAIVSTYNSEKFIHGCLDDLLNQTLYNKGEMEIIVVNSGSQQNEEKIVKRYQSKFKNIKYIKTERETVYQSWNRGIKESAGKYITNANTDDRHKKDALEILANELDKDDNVGLVYADSKVTSNENELYETAKISGFFLWPEFDPINLFRICYVGPQPMWRRSLHERYGYFDGSYKSAGDYEFWLRLVKKEKFKHINKILGLYLLSNESIEHENQKISLDESAKARLKHWDSESKLPKLFGTYLSYYECSADLPKSVEFSVVIPTCDRPEYLRDALKSLSSQTYKDFEVIVVNDGKIDVLDILKELNGTLHYQYLRHIVNRERSASRNNGIKISRGKYIVFLDDDDLFYSNHLKTLHDNLNSDILVVYTDAVRAKYEKTETGYKLINKSVPYSIDYERNKLLIGNLAPINCFAIPRVNLFKVGLFNESIRVLEDWELLLRLSEIVSFKHVRNKTCEVSWRIDGSSTTSSQGNMFDSVRKQIYTKYDSEIRKIPNITEIVDEFNNIWKNDFNLDIPVVTIIALSFNQYKYTKEFVQSLIKYTGIPFELIIIDNASEQDTIRYLEKLTGSDKRIKVIYNQQNLGFPKGVNQGLKIASGKFIVIANNDIVVTKGWLERMIEVAESDEKIGLVGPISNAVSGVQIDKDAKYQNIEKMHAYARKVKKKNSGNTLQFPRVAFLCTLIKREVIEKIGELDERFSPGNFEDDDFCLRAQLAGYKTVIAQDVFIHHYGSKSFSAEGTDKYKQLLETNQKKFIDKWGGTPEEIWLKGKQIKGNNIMVTTNKDKFVETLETAISFINEKDYASAQKYLQSLIEMYDQFDHTGQKMDLINLLNLAGNISILSNDLANAQKYFENALKLDNTSSLACSGLGDVFFASGNYDAAKTMYEWGVKNDSSNNAAVVGLAKANRQLNLPEGENSLLKEERQSNISDIVFNDMGTDSTKLIDEAYELFNQKAFDSALDKLVQAEKLFNGHLSNPSDKIFASSFYNMKGFVYLALNEIEKARDCFERALNINPKSSQACAGLGEVFFLTEHEEQAKTMYEWAVKNNPENKFAVAELAKVNELLGFPKNDSSLDEQAGEITGEDAIKINHRDEFGQLFNSLGLTGRGAEIGVQKGEYSRTLRSTWKGSELYLIDYWRYNPAYDDIANLPDERQKELYLSVVKKFADDPNVCIIRKDSVSASVQFPDEYFDWIYIDADHSFDGCTKDLNAWYPKLKPGGVLAGHDYIDGKFYFGNFGVKSAVESFIKKINAKLYITEEANFKSWYFIKPNSGSNTNYLVVENQNSIANSKDLKKLQSTLNGLLEASFELFGLKHFEEAIETLNKTEQIFYAQDDKTLISAFENMKGLNYLGMGENGKARESYETALNINPSSSQACAGLGELFYLEGKDKEAKAMYEYAVKYNSENQFAVGGLEKINKILGLSKEDNSLLQYN